MADYIYDPTGDAERLRRKRLLAQRMAESIWQRYDPMVDAGPMKVANWGDAVGQLARAFASRNLDKDLASDEQSTLEGQRNFESQQTQAYMDARSGKTIDSGTRDDMSPEPSTTRTRPDMNKALAIAMTSKIPSLMKLAENERASREALLKTPGASMASRTDAYESGDPTQLRPETKFMTSEGQIFAHDDTGQAPQQVADARGKRVDIPTPQGVAPGQVWQEDPATGQKFAVGRGPVVNVDTAGETALARGLGTEKAKILSEGFNRSRDYANKLPHLAQLFPLIDQAETGWGAEAKIMGRRIALALGLSEDEANKIGSSQTLAAGMAPVVFDMLKALRPASNTDLQWAQKVGVADLANDPRAMKYALGLLIAGGANEAQDYRKQFQTLSQNPTTAQALLGMEPVDLSLNEGTHHVRYDEASGKFIPLSMEKPPELPKASQPGQPPTPAGAALVKPAGISQAKWDEYLQLKERERNGWK